MYDHGVHQALTVSYVKELRDTAGRIYPGDASVVACAAAFRFATRHCRRRAVMVTVARMPHRSPPASRVMNCKSLRSSGVVVSIPINVTRPVANKIRATAVSIHLIRGYTTDRRAVRSASIPLPKNHQKRMPTNGQLRARQVLGGIPFGTHSRFAGLTAMYGNCATNTGKFSANGASVRISETFFAASSIRCLLEFNGGTMMWTSLESGTTLFFGVGREYE